MRILEDSTESGQCGNRPEKGKQPKLGCHKVLELEGPQKAAG